MKPIQAMILMMLRTNSTCPNLAGLANGVGCTGLAIAFDAEKLNGNQSNKERDDPSTVVDAIRSVPVVNDVASSGDFKGKDGQPADGVFPTAGETQGRIDEATDVHGEGTIDGVHDGQFGKSLHHQVAKTRSAQDMDRPMLKKHTSCHLVGR